MAQMGNKSNIDVVGLIERTITSINAPEITTVGTHAFSGCNMLEQATLDNATIIDNYGFSECSKLKRAFFPSCEHSYAYIFQNCTDLETAVFPLYDNLPAYNGRQFSGCAKLKSVDINRNLLLTNVFNGCSVFNLLVLRRSTALTGLGDINNFTGTPFANGGSGGDIYIPKALYDHLGDGSSLDYKSANRWGTIDGYGTITWHQIEGSYYEAHYADGTPI